jgi:NAD dependent epimerase/dehydratase family enzyme
MERRRIVIAGGSGFIGTALAALLTAQSYEVVVLSRSPKNRGNQVREIGWDGVSVGPWAGELAGAAAVINLAGRSIDCPHTPKNIGEFISSRVNSVKAIGMAVKQLRVPPRVWVQASAAGYYGDTGDHACDEQAPSGTDALAEVCRQWEAAISAGDIPSVRLVKLRIGFVVFRRNSGQWPPIYELDSSAGSSANFFGSRPLRFLERYLQCHCALSGDQCGIYADASAGSASTVEPARAGGGGALGRAADGQ